MVLSHRWRFSSISPIYHSFVSLSSPINPFSPTYMRFITNLSVHNSSNSISFLRLLNLCRNIQDLKPLGPFLIVRGLARDEFLVKEFIVSCFLLGASDIALSSFESYEKPSVLLQNVAIRCLCNQGLYEELLSLYRRCWVSGCPSDSYTFPFVIKACSALCALLNGKEVHCVVLRNGFETNLVIQTALVDFYGKNGRMGAARMLFDRISEPDIVSWNALISGYFLNGLTEEAFEVFRQIHVSGLKPNASTLAAVIPMCNRVGCLDIGRSVHGVAVKSEFFSNESLTPAFISMYAGVGDLSIATDMFDFFYEKNVVAWNALISAYTQNQKSCEGFKTFRKMLRSQIKPNMVTFVSIIPSCEDPRSAWAGESLHACVIKNGFENNLSVATALVSMYAKFGDINSAGFLFHKMPKRNLLSWNSIISAYVHNGLWEMSLVAVHEMQFAGFHPDAISVISILSACSKLGTIWLGKSAHALSLRKGMDLNFNVSNALLAFYSDCHQIYSCLKLFHTMAMRNIVSWNTLISGYVDNGEKKQAFAILQQMHQECVELDLVTLISILPSCNESENLVQGMVLHSYAIKTGYESDVSLVNALISMYINCRDIVAGRLLFEVMPERSVVSWNALITGYRYYCLHNEVMLCFFQMMKEDQKPNYVTLLNILPACSTLSQGKSVHAFAVRMGIDQEIPLLTSLMFMYARYGNIDLCSLLFEMGDGKHISLWNAIMSVHVQSKEAQKAVAFFCELRQMEILPDYMTILSLISACVQLTCQILAHSLMAYVIHVGFDTDVTICNAFIDLYARCGNISISRKLFVALLGKDAVSWSVMINGYGLHGDAEAALDLLSQMKLLRARPDAITYLSALTACSHSGLVEHGRMVFNWMLKDGIVPGLEHYACLVGLLGRKGHLNEAYDIAKRLPSQPSISLLESLLGACRIYGNVELGEKIGRLIFELDPENSVLYVMLYNIYAAAARWRDADGVRSNMEERWLRKTPGFSLVEGNEHQHDGCFEVS